MTKGVATMIHIVDWPMTLSLTEESDDTVAKAVVRTRDNTLTGEGRAKRNPGDPAVPEIGDELAAGRALFELSRKLMGAAARDIAAFGDEPVVLHD